MAHIRPMPYRYGKHPLDLVYLIYFSFSLGNQLATTHYLKFYLIKLIKTLLV